MDELSRIKIEKGIPVPPHGNTGNNSNSKYPFRKLEVGDSFLFPPGVLMKTAYASVQGAQKRGIGKFSVRQTPEGVRCWRSA